jgi:peroxiredoxin
MEPKRTDSWVAERMETLAPEPDWIPDAVRGWERFRGAQAARRRRAGLAAAAAVAGVGLLAFPATRVLAQRCVDACVDVYAAESASIARKFGLSRTVPNGARMAAPELVLTDSEGKTVRLADYRGQVVLLNFWATWCPPCKRELPWFAEFQNRLSGQGLQVLGVAMDEEGWTPVRPTMKAFGVNYPVGLGRDGVGTPFAGVEQLPTTFLIDRDGRIAVVRSGLVDQAHYEAEITRLLGEGR